MQEMQRLFVKFSHFSDTYVGPFENQQQCEQHIAFCAGSGDVAVCSGIVSKVPPAAFVVPALRDRQIHTSLALLTKVSTK